eukprot:3948004-Amphidinium_carterae.3
MADLRVQAFFDSITVGDLECLKAATGSDFDFNCHNPVEVRTKGCTALQAVVVHFLRLKYASDEPTALAAWLVKQGADPHLRSLKSRASDTEWCATWMDEDEDNSK